MKEDDDDFDDINDDDEGDAIEDVDTDTVSLKANRPRRGWRDIERMREQKEIEKLLAEDDWFDDLDRA